MFRRWPLPLLLVVAINASVFGTDESLTFEKHIRPIFRAHCFDCHGATEDIKGGLDLRLVRFMQHGGESGAAITPGQPDESYLIDRIRNGEMPPGEGRVPDEEIAVLERWIAEGAKTSRPEPETIGPGLGITPEERSFWSFQPIQRPAVPDAASFDNPARIRTPIDALIKKSLPAGIGFAPDADRGTVIKRLYFDLTGLPPSPEDLHTWIVNSEDDWYDQLLTSLLNSPHYGERWGRHWLDIAGYADSEGYTTNDTVRPWAWKYRDWVIRSLNADKPFDQFLTEQLAGDELAGPITGDLTPKQIDLLTATGFLRMAADGTGSGADNAESRNQVMADTLKIVGTSLLGLSVQCAQCHDHRYDPIPHTDYFALRAIFEPALDWQAWKPPNARRISLYTKADRDKAAELESQTTAIAAEKAKKLAEYMKQALEQELTKFAEPLRTELRTAYETPADKKTDEQKQLLDKHPSVKITPGNLYQYIADSKPELAKFDQKINEIRSKKPPEEFLRALVEPANHVPETKQFFRGDHQQPKQSIMPAALTIAAPEGEQPEFPVNDPELPTTGRRLAFAKWLTNGQHPLLARVIVNRVWLHHFGQGLVETPADFGKLGARPSQPELLDWLASEFMQQGWSLKKLHRLILTSTAWRQTAETADEQLVPHPQYEFTHRRLTRLDAETIRDRMLAASGQLDRTQFGSPIAIKEDDTGQIIVDGNQTRRSMYIQMRRSQPVAMLQTFDAPVMQTNCEMRPVSTVATQSLMLMNGEYTLTQAAHLAERAAKEAITVDADTLALLPKITTPTADWTYGFGDYDEAADRTGSFTPLTNFISSRWQAGTAMPDPKLGYVFLTANGGHPDVPGRAVIRRWTAPVAGKISVAGTLGHGSENGNGVRGRIISSRSGKAGEWLAFNGNTDTPVSDLAIEVGDTIDFITDGNGSHTSDSFTWPVTITLRRANQSDRVIVAADEFGGPTESPESIPGQIARAWQLAFCRPAKNEELTMAATFVVNQVQTLHDSKTKLPEDRSPVRQAMINLCQSLFGSNEFLYVD